MFCLVNGLINCINFLCCKNCPELWQTEQWHLHPHHISLHLHLLSLHLLSLRLHMMSLHLHLLHLLPGYWSGAWWWSGEFGWHKTLDIFAPNPGGPLRDTLAILWMYISAPWLPGTHSGVLAEFWNFFHMAISNLLMWEITFWTFFAASGLQEESTWSLWWPHSCFLHGWNITVYLIYMTSKDSLVPETNMIKGAVGTGFMFPLHMFL